MVCPSNRYVALVAALSVSLSACSGPGGEGRSSARPAGQSRPTAGGSTESASRLVIGVQQEPEVLTDIIHNTSVTVMISTLVFSRFVRWTPDGQLIPDLITEVPTHENGRISDDGRTIHYTLRSNARWHDGHPVTSADVRFTWRLIMNPDVNAEFRDGWDTIASMDTPDDTTVIVHLRRAMPAFVSTTFYEESVLPRHILEPYAGRTFHTAPFHRMPVGSGPYRVDQWVAGSHMVLRANPAYYGGRPGVQTIVIRFVPDEQSLLAMIQNHEIDWYDNASVQFLPQLERIPGIRIHRTPLLMYEHIDLNTENPILSDRRVRRALALATNRDEIVSSVYGGVVTPAFTVDPPGSGFFNANAARGNRYDPRRSRRLLRASGWVDEDGDGIVEKNGRELTLYITTPSGNANRMRTELLLRDQYRRIGVDLRIRNYSSTVLFGTFEDDGMLRTGNYELILFAWLSNPDPGDNLAIYSSDAIPPRGQNVTRIRNAELTRLLKAGATETDERRRIEIYRRVSEILVEEAPTIPLFWYTAIDAVTDRLKNFRPNPTQSCDTWNAVEWELEPRGGGASASR